MNEKCQICGRRAIYLSATSNVILTITKGVVGVLSGSKALVADAFHSGSDILCAVLAGWGSKFGEKPIDRTHPYGYGKIEFIIGVFVGIVLVFVAGGILYDALKILFFTTKTTPPRIVALWVALLSVYANFLVSNLTMCAAKELKSPALKAISIDNRSDAYSSIPVFICLIGSQLGLPQLDPLGAILVGLVVLKLALGLAIENYQGLLDISANPEEIKKIKEIVMSVPNVNGINCLKTRVTGRKIWVDLQICVNKRYTIEEANNIIREIKSDLMRLMPNISNVQIMLKPS